MKQQQQKASPEQVVDDNKLKKIQDQPHDLPGFKHVVFHPNLVIEKNQPVITAEATGTFADHILPAVTTRQIVEYDINLKYINDQNLKGIEYEDPAFDASMFSITKQKQFKAAKGSVWKRPADFQKGDAQIFGKQILPLDIKQGGLGDCYFLSSVSALSEMPELIKKLFITQTIQENGLYGVYLCHDGEFIQVALDDQFPCSVQGGPIFSFSVNDELWVLLLEKAYAKIYGTYDKIESGLAGHALRDLTGASSELFLREKGDQKDIDRCWDVLSKNYKLGYIMAASSQPTDKPLESIDKHGIVSQHCYAVLSVESVVGSDGKKDRIIQMRNPWGRQEWSGDWDDKSSKWTPELKQQLKVVDANDGIFWMSVNDFLSEFNEVCICKLHPKYLYNSIRLREVPKSEKITRRVLIMRVFKKTHGFVTLHQKDARMFIKEAGKKYSYSLSRMIIGKIDPKTNQVASFSGDQMVMERETVVESEFEPGDYAIYLEVEWATDYVRDMVVSLYGESSVTFSETETSDVTDRQILQGLLRVHQSSTKLDRVQDYGKKIIRDSGNVAGYFYYLYINDSESTTLEEEIKIQEREFIEICAPLTDSDCFKVQVPPKSSYMVKYRITVEGQGDVTFRPAQKPFSKLTDTLTLDQLQEQALQSNKKVQRKGFEVFVYELTYPAGVAILYCNNTKQAYKEQLQLTLVNLRGDNCNADRIQLISIPAGGTHIISLKSIDHNKPSSYTQTMTFSLE